MTVILDTHIWIWWLTSSPSLKSAERKSLDSIADKGGICLSAISLWEAQLLYSRKRLSLPVSFEEWLERATAPEVLSILPLDRDVIVSLNNLPETFHGDPADRLIVATAHAHGLPLATNDRAIRKSRVTKVWKA